MGFTIGISNLFLYCYFGKLATESFEKMADCLYDCNWYEVSIQLQKFLIIMIANIQKPIYYYGFRLAILNLETFTKVSDTYLDMIGFFCCQNQLNKTVINQFIPYMIRTVFSYYMMFKALAHDGYAIYGAQKIR